MSFTSSPSKQPLPASVRIIALGRAISVLGDEIALIALIFKAMGGLGHVGVAAMLIAGTAPLILVSPLAGLVVDRVRTRRVLTVATAAQALLCLALAWSSNAMMIALIALLACATAVATPAWQVLVPTLVTNEQLPGAMALNQMAFSAAGLAGPFLGGLLYAAVGFRSVLLIDVGSFLVLALVPLLLRADRLPTPRGERPATGDNFLSGVRFIARNAQIRSLVVLVTLVVLTFGVINIVEIFYTTTVLHAGARAYGFLGLCMGSGMLVASIASSKITRRFARTERVFVASCASLVVLLFAFSFCRAIWEAAVVLFVVGVANAVLNVQANILLVRSTAAVAQFRGRVFSALTASMSAAQILSIGLGGALLTIWTPRTIIVLGASSAALVLALTFRPVLAAHCAETAPSDEPVTTPSN